MLFDDGFCCSANSLFSVYTINILVTCLFIFFNLQIIFILNPAMDSSMDTSEKVYGGCEGPEAMYVKLISSDGHEFIVKREHALTSGTIKAMLSGPGQFSENETNEVNFREIPSHVLQKVCMYFTYKVS